MGADGELLSLFLEEAGERLEEMEALLAGVTDDSELRLRLGRQLGKVCRSWNGSLIRVRLMRKSISRLLERQFRSPIRITWRYSLTISLT